MKSDLSKLRGASIDIQGYDKGILNGLLDFLESNGCELAYPNNRDKYYKLNYWFISSHYFLDYKITACGNTLFTAKEVIKFIPKPSWGKPLAYQIMTLGLFLLVFFSGSLWLSLSVIVIIIFGITILIPSTISQLYIWLYLNNLIEELPRWKRWVLPLEIAINSNFRKTIRKHNVSKG